MTGQVAPPRSTAALRVVLVDDSEDLRMLLRVRLQMQELVTVVAEAADGREALEVVATANPDVVVMDLAMPEMDGLTAASRLRAAAPGVVLIALTGYSREALEDRSLAAGFDHFIVKGNSLGELEELLRSVALDRAG